MLPALTPPLFSLRQRAVDALEAEHIAYAVLHGWEGEFPGENGDLDLVVEAASLPRITRALQRTFSLVQMLHYQSSGIGFVIRPRAGPRQHSLIVDCSSDFRWRGLVLFHAPELLAERRRVHQHWLVAPGHEFAYLLAKKIFEKRFFPEPQRHRIRQLLAELGAEADAISFRLMGEGWGRIVCQAIRREDWDLLARSMPALRRALLVRRLAEDPGMLLRYLVPEIRRLGGRWRRPTGLWVNLLGPDGSGKTTLAQRLEQSPPPAFRRTLRFHLRPQLWPAGQGSGPVSEPHAQVPRCRLASAIKAVYYSAREWIGYLAQVRPALVRSTLVIADRCYDDIFLDPQRYRMHGPGSVMRRMRRFLPRPDLSLVLLASAGSIAARKQEVPPAELEAQLAGYREWAARTGSAVLLDSDAEPARVYDQAREIINNVLEQRTCLAAVQTEENGAAKLEILGDWRPQAWDIGGDRSGSYARWVGPDGRQLLTSLASPRVSAQGLKVCNAQKKSSRLLAALLGTALRAGLAQPFVRQIRISPPQGPFLHWLQQVTGEKPLHCSLSMGPAGPHQKCVLQLMRPDGSILGYAKVGCNQQTVALVENEVRFLRRLSEQKFSCLVIPELLYAGWLRDRFVAVTRQASPPVSRAPAAITSLHLEALRELRESVNVAACGPAAAPGCRRVASSYYCGLVEQATARARQWLGPNPLPGYTRHGDFTPWNLRLVAGRLLAFDWEYASGQGTPGYDLIHFFFRVRALKSAGRIYAPAVVDRATWRELTGYLDAAGCADLDPRALVLLYLADQIAFLYHTDGRDSPMLRDLAAAVHVVLKK